MFSMVLLSLSLSFYFIGIANNYKLVITSFFQPMVNWLTIYGDPRHFSCNSIMSSYLCLFSFGFLASMFLCVVFVDEDCWPFVGLVVGRKYPIMPWEDGALGGGGLSVGGGGGLSIGSV